jgi:hypothetical protein
MCKRKAKPMDPSKISERMRRQFEGMPPEKRAKAEAAFARTRTPEFRARAIGDRPRRCPGRVPGQPQPPDPPRL